MAKFLATRKPWSMIDPSTLKRKPTFGEVRSSLREVRRVEKLTNRPLTRNSVEHAYGISTDQLNDYNN